MTSPAVRWAGQGLSAGCAGAITGIAAAGSPLPSAAVIPDRLRPLLDETRPVAERDLLLGRETSRPDLDLTTDARPEETKRLLAGWADAIWTQGERFGTIGAKRGDRLYEITTHRAEAYRPDSRKPDVKFGDAVEADLSRRDFTVNAMALSLPEPELIDPFGGAADLAAKRLRTPLSPDESFTVR